MTGIPFLDWLVLAVSLFNTLLLIWLGLTVLLNAERRTPGLWIASGALFLGGLFFLIHTIIVGFNFQLASPTLDFWWRMGWLPVVCLPFAWYTVILWYSGYWEPEISGLRLRHRTWFFINLFIAGGAVGLILFGQPLPTTEQLLHYNIQAVPAIAGVPLLFVLFPIYTLLCVALSLDVLRRPGPSTRVMGELARQRALPWLTATSLVLLLVSLIVGLALAFFILSVNLQPPTPLGAGGQTSAAQVSLGWLDLLIASLIGFAILMVGQAIVSYEVFTGKTLPRRGLRRFWRRAVILAAGFGILLAGFMQINLPQIYTITLATIFVAVFYALLSWRSYIERERSVEALRPFVSSQQLLAQILSGSEATPQPDRQAFDALCSGLLGARLAYLAPVGEMAPLAGPPLAFPPKEPADPALLGSLAARLAETPALLCQPLPADIPIAAQFEGQAWVVPLWSQRGLIGMLLLGEKMDNSLYTQEEMELARLAGERILDGRASAEVARRLVALQRQRIAESQVIDRRARRVLHDEVLPSLHAALLHLSAQPGVGQEPLQSLSEVHNQISSLLRELPSPAAPELAQLGLLGAIQQLVETEFCSSFDRIAFQSAPNIEEPARRVPPLAAEVVYYAAREAIRNAARHGRGGDEGYHLSLDVQIVWQDGLKIIIEDNGVGLPANGLPASTAAPPPSAGAFTRSSGQGLALHSTLLAVLGGSLELTNNSAHLTRLTIFLPQKAFQEWR